MTRSRTLTVVGTAAALAIGATALAGSAGAAPAKPPKALKFTYDAAGTSHIAKPNSDVALGPAVLSAKIAPDGSFTATLPLPPTTSSFKVLGLVPISATVTFVPVGKVKGALAFTDHISVSTTATYYINLSNVKAAGIPTPVGTTCQTSAPVTIPLATPADQAFDLGSGGTVTGTYTIGNFANCGLMTGLINLLVPGAGNTASVTLSNGQAQN